MDASHDHERHPAGVPELLGHGQARQRDRAGGLGRWRYRQSVHIPAVHAVRLWQTRPAAPAGPLAERSIPLRSRSVLVQAENGQYARLSPDLRRQRAPARHGAAARPAPVDHVRRGRRGAADRGPAHELYAGDHVAQGRSERNVQLVQQRGRAEQHHGHVERRRGGLGVWLVLIRHP